MPKLDRSRVSAVSHALVHLRGEAPLTLTPQGREMVDKIAKEATTLEHDLLSALTDPEIDLMVGFMERLEKRLQETRSALKA